MNAFEELDDEISISPQVLEVIDRRKREEE
jgi:hypothetical protein